MRSSTRRFALFAALLLLVPASNANPSNLPDLGDESGIVISPAEERKIGERVFRHIRGSQRFVSDPEVSQYIQDLGQKLVAHSDSTDAPFTFFVLEDPTINAFAIPGGFIGMHTGLIMAAQSESEVAGVLAHEIAHITQRHLQRMFAESKRTSRKVLLGMLAALALAAAGESAGAGAAVAVAQAGGIQQQLNFSRANEEEADRVGIEILAGSGLDPQAMPAFFERLQTWGRLNETNLPEFLQTHPVTTNRIADSRDRAQRYPYRQVPDTIEFYRVRAKLRAQAPSDPNRIVSSFKDNLVHGKYRNLEAERYGYAWALLRVSGYDAAREQATILIKDHPNTVFYWILQSEVEMQARQYEAALQRYAEAEKRFPRNQILARYYAAALLKAGHAQPALRLVEKAMGTNNTDDPLLLKMLATAAGETGDLFQAHRALAAYYYESGNPGAAIQQLQIARRYAGDSFYLQAGVDARIKEIEQELGDDDKKK